MRNGQVPANPGRDEPRPDWEPVITRPDPMTAEEWQAWLDCEPGEDADPEACPDEEDYLSPDEVDLTEAGLAEIAEAAALAAPVTADEADPAGVADDELTGVLCAWDRLESHVAARKLAASAAAELSRRRPVIESPSSGRPAGTARRTSPPMSSPTCWPSPAAPPACC